MSGRRCWLCGRDAATFSVESDGDTIVLLGAGDVGDAGEVERYLQALSDICANNAILIIQDRAEVVEDIARRIGEANEQSETAVFADTLTDRAILAARGFHHGESQRISSVAKLPSVAVRERASRSKRSYAIRLTSQNTRLEGGLSPQEIGSDSYLVLEEARELRRCSPSVMLGGWPLSAEETDFLHHPSMRTKAQTCAVYRSARANGAGVIVTADEHLAEESFLPLVDSDESTFWGKSLNVRPDGPPQFVGFYDGHFLLEAPDHEFYTTTDPEPRRTVEGPAVLMGGLYHHVFAHWIYDILSKAWVLPELRGHGLDDFRCVFPGPLKPKQIEMAERAGIPEDKIIQLGLREWAAFELLYVPSRPIRMYDYMIPEVFRFYETFVDPLDIERIDSPRRFYIARREMSHRRNLLNEDAVIDCLREFGFVPLVFDEISLDEELALFANADIVISPHSSAMASMSFMQPGSSVLCLITRDMSKVVRHHQNICSHKGVELRILFGEPFQSRSDIAHWVTDVDLLREMVEKLLEDRKESQGG